MRVLILSAFLAVAAAAPSGLFAPVVVPAVRAVAVPAAIPTISPGDIQAAVIDAQVQAQDQAQAAADNARLLMEVATEKAATVSNVAEEQNLEAYWSAEDKKWQAVDALKTAEAQLDGAVASNANIIAKSAVSGVLPYVAAVGPISPILAPIPQLQYSSFVAPQSYSTQTLITGQEIKTEIKEESKEAAVKTAEPLNAPEPAIVAKTAEAEKAEKLESSETPAVKAAENLNEKPALIAQPLLSSPLGLTNVYRYDVAVPGVGPVLAQPILNYAAVQQLHGVLTPTFVKTAW